VSSVSTPPNLVSLLPVRAPPFTFSLPLPIHPRHPAHARAPRLPAPARAAADTSIARLLRQRLEESGFDDDLKDLAKEKARKAGAPSLAQLVAEVTPEAERKSKAFRVISRGDGDGVGRGTRAARGRAQLGCL
jgi:hypothetical protein